MPAILGTEIFPAIVEQTAFDKAQAIKFDRNTQKDIRPHGRDPDASGSGMLRNLRGNRCAAFMTAVPPIRKSGYAKAASTAIKITDTDLLRAITDRLNDLLADPEQVHYTPATHESPVELLRLKKNEIGRMLDGTMIDKDLLKNTNI